MSIANTFENCAILKCPIYIYIYKLLSFHLNYKEFIFNLISNKIFNLYENL